MANQAEHRGAPGVDFPVTCVSMTHREEEGAGLPSSIEDQAGQIEEAKQLLFKQHTTSWLVMLPTGPFAS